MNLAEKLSQFNLRSREQWLLAANRVLPPILSAVLVIAIAYQFAGITTSFLPGTAYGPAPEVARVTGPAPGSQATDLSSLTNWHPFGEARVESIASEPLPAMPVDAPDTSLNLKLTGVIPQIFNEHLEQSEAMIQSGNQPDQRYRVGETIEGAGGATLHHVYHDRVILNRNGRLETLRLPEELTSRANSATGRPAAPMPGTDQSSLRQVISANASRLTDIIRLAPHVEGGQVVGFRINPGREAETFDALGLRAGDVVTDINGLALNDPSRGLQAFEALGETTMANVTVLRDGSPQVIVIDTSQLDALSEDRQ